MIVQIPFAGFYSSIHDEEVDRTLVHMFSDRWSGSVENPHGLLQRAVDAIDWQSVHKAYAVKFCEMFANEVGIAAAFEGMNSPREYNFETDRIFATVSTEEVQRWLGSVSRATLETVAEEWFRSRSGFISSYSYDVDTWGEVVEWDHNQLGALLESFTREKMQREHWDEDDSAMDYQIASHMSEAGFIDEALCNGGGEFLRILDIHDYLERRAERA